MRMWVLAIDVAVICSDALALIGLIDLRKSPYTGPRVTWISGLVGGCLLGFGMTLAWAGSKTLIGVGAGKPKGWVVLVMLGVAAYMTVEGLFAV